MQIREFGNLIFLRNPENIKTFYAFFLGREERQKKRKKGSENRVVKFQEVCGGQQSVKSQML
jgi:hypothetical protein